LKAGAHAGTSCNTPSPARGGPLSVRSSEAQGALRVAHGRMDRLRDGATCAGSKRRQPHERLPIRRSTGCGLTTATGSARGILATRRGWKSRAQPERLRGRLASNTGLCGESDAKKVLWRARAFLRHFLAKRPDRHHHCRAAAQRRWLCGPQSKMVADSAKAVFSVWSQPNPLKSLNSDEGIQGNPNKSKGVLLGFPWISFGLDLDSTS
jgi:hypothetical protein